MAGFTDSDPYDRALGLNQRMCRRDFMNSILIASGSLLLGSLTPQQLLGRDDWTGYGICHPDAVDALCAAWQVTLIDPEWGRRDALWDMLAAFCPGEVPS